MVQISRADKRKVYLHLLNEGVIVLKKDYTYEKHKDTGVSNLFVWMLLRTLKSKDLVDLVFNWQYFYYYVKTEGVDYLRKKVGIFDDKIVPVTFKQGKKQQLLQNEEDADVERPRRGGFGGRGQRFGGRGGSRGGRGDRRDRGEEGAPEGGEGGQPQEGGDRPRGGRFGGRGRPDRGGEGQGQEQAQE